MPFSFGGILGAKSLARRRELTETPLMERMRDPTTIPLVRAAPRSAEMVWGVVRCIVMWCGVVWCSGAWCGGVWCGGVKCGVAQHAVVG